MDESPWPLYVSFGVFSLMVAFVEFVVILELNYMKMILVLSQMLLSVYGWLRDICYEGTFQGMHSIIVQAGLKLGFLMFILSELMFFMSIFWSLFYYSVSPSVNLGGWPPVGLSSVNPLGIPLLGTILLMSSGISITWSHHSIMNGKKSSALVSLGITILLGITFSLIQLKEYMSSSFSISDSVYGSVFYLSTGFHGMHVLVGSVFLMVCFIRIWNNQMSQFHHVGYEFAIWYWHFVDVVWLFLYICVYWWGW